jgi:N-acetylglutamate synthase-like GNAT family acetyltransferase
MISLRPARPDEAVSLTALCLRSKAVWGYTDEFMNACRPELTLTKESIASSRIEVAEIDGRLVGMAQLIIRESAAELDKLFVEPDYLRSGAGRALLTWAKAEASQLGAEVLLIDADPHAANFYRRLGASDDGFVRSASIPDRLIPRLKVELEHRYISSALRETSS